MLQKTTTKAANSPCLVATCWIYNVTVKKTDQYISVLSGFKVLKVES